jgi:hypothetical protein
MWPVSGSVRVMRGAKVPRGWGVQNADLLLLYRLIYQVDDIKRKIFL